MRLAIAALAIVLLGAGDPRVRLNIDVRDAKLTDVVALLSLEGDVNIIPDASLPPGRVTLHLVGVTFDEALAALVTSQGLSVRRTGTTLIVGSSEAFNRGGVAGGALGAQTQVLTLHRADPTDVAKELAAALPVGTIVVPDRRTDAIVISGDGATVDRARSLVAALDGPGAVSSSGDFRIYRLRYLRAEDALKMLKVELPDGVVAVADPSQNALLVRGDEDAQRLSAAFAASVDVAGRQVAFEVRVADVTPQDDSSNVGFEFGGVDLQGQPLAGATAYAFPRGTLAVNARLDALVSHGRAQILATPRLVALNNREADLLIGQTYPIVYSNSAFGGQQVQFVDVGVKLRLTPTIGPDGSVTADIHPEYSEIEGFTAGNLPIIANRKIDSTLRVASDQTIVLGGLMRDVSSETVTKLPGLADIPVLGAFFKSKATRHQRNEIVFLITPHVIEPGAVPPSS
ncbi:MAG TPA: secretin N-terminal domain-containing protein [Candidatus Baltobacteraceae bacterium]